MLLVKVLGVRGRGGTHSIKAGGIGRLNEQFWKKGCILKKGDWKSWISSNRYQDEEMHESLIRKERKWISRVFED